MVRSLGGLVRYLEAGGAGDDDPTSDLIGKISAVTVFNLQSQVGGIESVQFGIQ